MFVFLTLFLNEMYRISLNILNFVNNNLNSIFNSMKHTNCVHFEAAMKPKRYHRCKKKKPGNRHFSQTTTNDRRKFETEPSKMINSISNHCLLFYLLNQLENSLLLSFSLFWNFTNFDFKCSAVLFELIWNDLKSAFRLQLLLQVWKREIEKHMLLFF